MLRGMVRRSYFLWWFISLSWHLNLLDTWEIWWLVPCPSLNISDCKLCRACLGYCPFFGLGDFVTRINEICLGRVSCASDDTKKTSTVLFGCQFSDVYFSDLRDQTRRTFWSFLFVVFSERSLFIYCSAKGLFLLWKLHVSFRRIPTPDVYDLIKGGTSGGQKSLLNRPDFTSNSHL